MKIYFYDKVTARSVLDTDTYFLNTHGKVCQIVSRGDNTFLTIRHDIGYSLERSNISKERDS